VFAIAPGATVHRRRVIWSHHDWTDKDRIISRASFGVFASTRGTIDFRNKYMWGAVTALGPREARDLANYFAALNPKAANDGNSDLAARGRTIYLDGIPEANIVSCYAFHGPNAEGVRDIPRLGGLAYFYLKGRLEQWGEGYHSGIESPMPLVASKRAQTELRRSLHTSASSSELQAGSTKSATAIALFVNFRAALECA
jgi:cytochrome c553